MRADDPSLQQRIAVFEAWPAAGGIYTTAELIILSDPAEGDFGKTEGGKALREALLAVAPGSRSGVDATALGKWLAANRDRVLDGQKLVREDGPRGRPRWKIEEKGAPGAV